MLRLEKPIHVFLANAAQFKRGAPRLAQRTHACPSGAVCGRRRSVQDASSAASQALRPDGGLAGARNLLHQLVLALVLGTASLPMTLALAMAQPELGVH